MGSKVSRWVAAAGSVAVAAAVNVTTGLLTQRWAVAWFAATVMLVVLRAGLQIWLTVAGDPARTVKVSASGEGSIAGAGPVINSSTKVSRPTGAARRPMLGSQSRHEYGEVRATGLGAIASGRAVEDSHTEIISDGPES